MSKGKKVTATKAKAVMETGVASMFVVAGALIGIYHFFLSPVNVAEAKYNGPAQSIVVIDTKLVLQAYMQKWEDRIAGGAEYTQEQIFSSSADFGAEYFRAIKKYRDAGYVVIDKQYALGVPSGAEITAEIGRALDLTVEPAPDPFEAPKPK
jgi:hypothetical protein